MVKWKKKAGKADSSHSRTQFQGLQVKGRKCVDKSVIICEGESGSVICFNELTSATYSWLYPRFCQNVTSEITISNIKFSVYIFPSSSSFAQVTPLQQFFDLVNPPIHTPLLPRYTFSVFISFLQSLLVPFTT